MEKYARRISFGMKPYQVDMRPGDTVRVTQKVKEGNKTRLQAFEGIILARKHGRGITGTITVRKVSLGVGVERVFPIHSPMIEKVEIVRRAQRVRRAKLYYLRHKAARDQRRKMKQVRFAPPTDGAAEETAPEAVAESEKTE